jgi:ABC-type transporter Mla maintaining outer membrane lipid asymmetry permease subunit MlaE
LFKRFLENIGEKVIIYLIELYEFIVFFIGCSFRIFSFNSYSQTSINFLFEQIYLSAIKKLFIYIFFAILFGSTLILAIISMAINLSFSQKFIDLLTSMIINELSPIFCTIFFILTYSLSSHEKIKVLKKDNDNLIDDVYIPKMFISGFIVSSFYFKIDFFTYKEMILSSIGFKDILLLLIKTSIFGFIAISVPIYFGHKKQNEIYRYTEFIIKMLTIMLSLIIMIELLFVVILY